MYSSSASPSRYRPRSAGGRARCQCGLPLIIYTARTRVNTDRRFLRCRRWQLPDTCGFFFWIDDPSIAVQRSHAQVESDATSLNSEIGNSSNSVHVVPELNKKIMKLKKKLEVERFQKKLACLFTVLAMIVAIGTLCMRKG
ncbi:uncharacterized protein At4g04775-like [Lotus japonicus]|uniref:uncharacterized protein At4g04775-like n=1 Tax=Lotus japonicus TaxID=34305 RepID=UPI00258AD052|nr:uncharacterized protein At4g04775-like [Lotus japonicus]